MSHRSRFAASMRRRAAGLLLLVPLGASACILLPIPTPEHGLVGGTGIVSEAETRLLELGHTTRQDVLLHFGEPALSRCQERILVYHWAVAHGWVIVAIGGGPAPGAAEVFPFPIPKSYLVVFEFDPDGRLVRVNRSTDLLSFEPKPGPLLPEDCEEPPAPSAPRETLADFLAQAPDGAVDVAAVPPTSRSLPVGTARQRLRIEPFLDARSSKLEPNRLAAPRFLEGFGVWSYRPVTDLVRAAVAETWLAAGHELREQEADFVVEGRVEQLDLDVDWNWTWLTATERSVSLGIALRVHSAHDPFRVFESRYIGRAREPMRWSGDAAGEWGDALEAALRQLADAMANDPALARFLAR